MTDGLSIPNTIWRIKFSVLDVAPPFIIGYMVYNAVEKEHDRLQRKQTGQFDHENFENRIKRARRGNKDN